MKTNELRIGNFINHEDFNVPMMVSGILLDDNRIRVAAIGGQSTVMVGGSCSPIPLTEEWLFKFGFYQDGRSYKLKNFGRFIFHEIGISFYPSGILKSLLRRDIIQSVHQLQNLFFALTNEELTIK
jgi:hypothetical protein